MNAIFFDKYEVEYIYVGPLERTLYHPDGIRKFELMARLGLLEAIYQNEGVIFYRVTRGTDV